MAHTLAGVDRNLVSTVNPGGRRREHLAYPIRRELEHPDLRKLYEPFSRPSRDIGNEDITREVKLGLEQDPPSAGTAAPALKGVMDVRREGRCRVCMARRGTGRQGQITLDDLGDLVGWGRDDVLVNRTLLDRVVHEPRLLRNPRNSEGNVCIRCVARPYR